jgi:hypothetical protein
MDPVAQAPELALENSTKAFNTPEVNQMLWNKYTDKGEYVVLFDVPNIVGIKQERRCDAIVIGMWGSTGRLIHGFEIKTSRGDWLREVKDVSKADPFIEQCDRWWLVTGNIAVAKPEEIPAAWGWMNATRTGLRIERPPHPIVQDETRIRRLWAFALIRRAAERNGPNSTEFKTALERCRKEAEERADREIELRVAQMSPDYEALKKRVEEFEKSSGMKLNDWRLGNVGKLARTIHALKEDGYGGFTKRLQDQLRELHGLRKKTQEALDAVGDPALAPENDND